MVITLKTTTSPKKATYKKYKWTSSKKSVATVIGGTGSSVKVTTKKEGTATITAKAMDGSGKKAKIKLKVGKFESDKTAAPTPVPDTRITTTIEDFEDIAVGTTWDKFTAAGKLNADGTSTSGSMTVVTDPENANNKCLQIKYTGPDAYDFAPVFSADIDQLKDSLGNPATGKKLSNYTGVKLNARIVGTSGDVTYKKIYCYFDQYGKITKADKFAANANKSNSAHVDGSGNPVAAGAANEDRSIRFGVEIPMAEGSDKEYGITLFNGNASKESNKYFPFYYSTWQTENASTHFTANSCTSGFKLKEADGTVGFASRTLAFNTGRINEADSTLLNQSKFDVVLGSTYGGSTKNTGGTDLTLYIDDVALVEEQIPIQDFTLSLPEGGDVVYPGGDVTPSVAFTPADTTQKELTWTTNNEQATVDTEGKVTIAEDFVLANNETTEVVVTATSKANPALTKSVTIKVVPIELPTEPYVVDFETMYDAELSGDLKPTKGTDENGTYYEFKFTGANQRIYFKFPEEINLSGYQKYELTGYSEMQITMDFWDSTLPEKIAQNKADTDAGSETPYKWYRSWVANTTPFFSGSDPNRMADGTFVGPWGIEKESNLLSSIKSKQATDAPDVAPGDYNKARYVAIGNAIGDSPEDGGTAFRIYDLRLTPRPTGELKEFPFTTMPLTESFEGESITLNGLTNSKVITATEDAPAQDGEHYLEVATGEIPGILIDNREGTEDVTYNVVAYVKAKDPSVSGNVGYVERMTYQGSDYETYQGYEAVDKLSERKGNPKDLSDESKANEWQKLAARITVKAGKISELNIGDASGRDDFEFYLDNITVTPK